MPPTRPAHVIESSWNFACDPLGQKVAGNFAGDFGGEASLYSADGARKYINRDEHLRFIEALNSFDPKRSLFGLLLACTGARISELLALTPRSFQVESNVVTFVTLKRRKHSVREVPIPEKLMRDLDRCFSIRRAQLVPNLAIQRLWTWCRVTAWRVIKEAMKRARIAGPQACPRGLRHGFGVGMLQRRAPIHLIQRWMGHARLSTTMIYMDVCGPDEFAFAKPFWQALMFEREKQAA